MTDQPRSDRRTALKLVGLSLTAGTAAVAGCTAPTGGDGEGDGDEPEDGADTPENGDTPEDGDASEDDDTPEDDGDTPEDGGTPEDTETPEDGDGDGGDSQTFRFDGVTEGWEGAEPDEIAGETNPALELEAGTEYEVVWENADGQPHDFVIQDENEEELEGTEQLSEEGETASLTFTASEEMTQYICTVHPTSMVGEITISGG